MGEFRVLKFSEIEKVNILGRECKQKNPYPLLANGSGIEMRVTGADFYIKVITDCTTYEPWVAYEINGAFMGRQMLLPGEHNICLFRNMTPETPKTIKFYRELQSMSEDDTCCVLIDNIRLDGEILDPPVHDRKIEFIGDSITSGEGTYGAMEDVDWLSKYMSFSNDYANMVGKDLNADVHMVSQGGWGVYCGWDNDTRHNIPSVYEKLCGLANGPMNSGFGTQSEYDFKWQADVIVVNLGTNDESAFNEPPFEIPDTGVICKQRRAEDGSHLREDELKVEKAIIDFLKTIRKHTPGAHIVWCYGMLGYGLSLTINEAIINYINETGDHNVAFLQLPDTFDEDYGSHMHPGVPSHRKSADVIVNYLRRKMDWKD